MKRGLVLILCMLFLAVLVSTGLASAAAINDTFHINLQTTFSNGSIQSGTFAFAFNITENSSSLCGAPIAYNYSTSLTTDSRGIVSLYLPTVGSGGGNLSNLSFDKQYYLCYYRDGVLKDVSQLGRVPYSFRATQVNLSEVTINSNLNLNNSGQYNITANYGFFTYLGSLLNRITTLFVQDINASRDINISGVFRGNGSGLTNVNSDLLDGRDSSFFMPLNTSVSGNFDFNGGWQNNGFSIVGGNIFAQTGFFVTISSLNVTNLNTNGSLIPILDNTFDIGNSSLRYRDLFVARNTTINGSLNVNEGTLFVNDGNGRVGINITTPQNTLNVKGGFNVSNISGVTSLFVNETSGNVGIGTTSPSGQLTLGADSKEGIRIISTAGFFPFSVYDSTNTTVLARISPVTGEVFSAGTFSTDSGFRVTAFGAYTGVLSGNRFVFNNGNIQVKSSTDTEVARFTDSNFGINTTTPQNTLNVRGDANITGLCVAEDSLISMADGSKKMIKDVKAGEYVLSLDEETGRIVSNKVTALLDMGEKPIFELATESGRSINTTGSHPYLVELHSEEECKKHEGNIWNEEYNEFDGNSCTRWVSVNELEEGDYIAVPNPDANQSFMNLSTNSDVEYTGTSFCSLNASSLDQIPQLRSKANSKYGTSLECGANFSAFDCISTENSYTGNISSLSFRILNTSITSDSEVPQILAIFPVFFSNSSIKYGEAINLSLSSKNSSCVFAFPMMAENKIVASTTSSIYSPLNFLAIDSEISSVNFLATLSDTLTLDENLFSLFNFSALSNIALLAMSDQSNLNFCMFFSNSSGSFIVIVPILNDNVPGLLGAVKSTLKTLVSDSQKSVTLPSVLSLKETSHSGQGTIMNNQFCYIKLSRPGFHFEKITSIKPAGTGHVYDLAIENTHNFIANDIVAHNTYLLNSKCPAGQVLTTDATTGLVSCVSSGSGTVSGSGTSGFIARFNGTTSINNSLIFENGTNIGIGTTEPTSAIGYSSASRVLGISGDGSASVSAHGILSLSNNRATPVAGDATGQIDFVSVNNGGAGAEQGVRILSQLEGSGGTNGFGAYIRFDTKPDNTTAVTERMRITSSGNIGINTTSPNNTLHVNAGSTSSFTHSGYAGAFSSPTFGLIIQTDGSAANPALRVLTNGSATEAFRVDNTGNVGIGTTSPTNTLTVNGSIDVITNGSNRFVKVGDTVDDYGLFRWISADNYLSIETAQGGASAGNVVLQRTAGNVGIGTAVPGKALDVVGDIRASGNLGTTNGVVYMDNFSGNNFFQLTGGVTSVFDGGIQSMVWNNGNVGIGTTSPQNKFNVIGDGNFTGTIYQANNPVLDSSDLSGVIESTTGSSGGTGTGWKEVAIASGANGRGGGRVTIWQGGGSGVPFRLVLEVSKSWDNNNAALSVLHYTGGGNINGTRLVFNSTDNINSVQVFFTSNVTSAIVEVVKDQAGSDEMTAVNFASERPGTTLVEHNIDSNELIGASSIASGNNFFRVTGTNLLYQGKVGINTTSPQSPLTVKANDASALAIETLGRSTDNSSLLIFYDTNRIAQIVKIEALGTGGGKLQFSVNGSQRLVIDGSGNVGIGTTAPARLLDITIPFTKNDTSRRGIAELGKSNDTSGYSALQISMTGANSAATRSWDFQTIEAGIANAGNLAFQVDGGNVGIGTTSPTTNALHIDGAGAAESGSATPNGILRLQDDATTVAIMTMGIVGGAGTHGWIQPRANNAATFYNLVLNPNGGNVGIGTTSPAVELEINSSGNSDLFLTSADIGQSILGFGDQSADTRGYIQYRHSSFDDLRFGTAGADRVLIDNSGNVGINTTAPGITLDIVGTTTGSLRLADATADATNKLGRIVGRPFTNADGNFLAFDIRGLSGTNQINYGGGSGVLNTVNQHSFYTGATTTTLTGTERLRIDSSGNTSILNGNLGIGTTSPGKKLHLENLDDDGIKFTFTGNLFAHSITNFFASDGASNNMKFNVYNGTTDATVMTLLGNGNVGIGTTSPQQPLHVVGVTPLRLERSGIATFDIGVSGLGGQNDLVFAPTSTNGYLFQTNSGNTNALRIMNDGKVGIGTTAPQNTLNVVGTLNSTSTISTGLSDNSGARLHLLGATSNKNWMIATQQNFGGLLEITPSTTGGGSTFTTPAVVILDGGNVGIGTTSPVDKFTVQVATNKTLGVEESTASAITDFVTGAAAIQFSRASDGSNNLNGIFTYQTASNDKTNLAFAARDDIVFATGGGSVYTASTEKMRILGTGNVGVGTTSPLSLMQVGGNLTVGSGATAGTVGNVQITTGGASPINNRLTFGTDGTGWKFAIGKNQAGTISEFMTIQDNGNVGIATTSPSSKLEVSGDIELTNLLDNDATNFFELSGCGTNTGVSTVGSDGLITCTADTGTGTMSSWLLAASGTAGTESITDGETVTFTAGNAITSTRVTNTVTIGVGNDAIGDTQLAFNTGQALMTASSPTFAGLTLSGNLNMGGKNITNVDHIDANFYDPIYNINGIRYATYLPGMSGGLKEEVTGTVMLNSNYVIDFKKLERGSNLWLFYQITDFGSNMENLQVILTPGFDGKVWYTKDSIAKTLTIHGSQAGEVSYRMTANRFDWRGYSDNLAKTESNGLIVPLKK